MIFLVSFKDSKVHIAQKQYTLMRLGIKNIEINKNKK